MLIIYDRSNSYKILFINRHGKLKELYTPFQVCCLTNVGSIKAHTLHYVELIGCTYRDELVYIIHGVAYHYYFFCITAQF